MNVSNNTYGVCFAYDVHYLTIWKRRKGDKVIEKKKISNERTNEHLPEYRIQQTSSNSLRTTHKRVSGELLKLRLNGKAQVQTIFRSGNEVLRFRWNTRFRYFNISSAKYSNKSLHPFRKLGAQRSKRLSQQKTEWDNK